MKKQLKDWFEGFLAAGILATNVGCVANKSEFKHNDCWPDQSEYEKLNLPTNIWWGYPHPWVGAQAKRWGPLPPQLFVNAVKAEFGEPPNPRNYYHNWDGSQEWKKDVKLYFQNVEDNFEFKKWSEDFNKHST